RGWTRTTTGTILKSCASSRPRSAASISDLARVAFVDPGAELRDAGFRPGAVARHRPVAQTLVDRVGRFAHVVVARQVEPRPHGIDVLVAKEGPDIGVEAGHVNSSPGYGLNFRRVRAAPPRLPVSAAELLRRRGRSRRWASSSHTPLVLAPAHEPRARRSA